MKKITNIRSLVILVAILVLVNVVFSYFYTRIDLTQDKRYTLSKPAKEILDQVKSPLIIDVFLEGDFPPEFRKLQNETRYLLEEITNYNPQISYVFSNPVDENSTTNEVAQQFASFGMDPLPLKVKRDGKESSQTIFPWATANFNRKAAPISLVKNIVGASPEEFVKASTQNLEYAFIEGINKLVNEKSKRIAVLKDNGELSNTSIADFFGKVSETYDVETFPMNAAQENPEQTLKALQNTFDLIVVAKPTKPFTEKQKFVLDQYTINGGKSLWLIDQVAVENDSMRSNNGKTFALPRDLNLADFFFKYGLRINPVLVKDLYSAPLSLATGDGSESRYTELPWFYQPQVPSFNSHPINTNIEHPIRFNYASQIELLNKEQAIKKSILLSSSPLSNIEAVPRVISLEQVTVDPKEEDYAAGPQPLAVLLEGKFPSAYTNRIVPVEMEELRFRESGIKPAKMVVISDGDLIANKMDSNGNPLELGFDYYTRKQYGNKEFLLNTINYLLDDSGLINIRSKEISIAFLDGQKTSQSISLWQSLCIGLPLLILLLFGILFNVARKKRYAH